VVFDREGYSPDFFAKMKSRGGSGNLHRALSGISA
jgi:hypothetical protein